MVGWQWASALIGCSLCLLHDCPLCGDRVEDSGLHGLSCRRSQGRLPRHSALNYIVKRALSVVNIPATLEPSGLCQSDKRPAWWCLYHTLVRWAVSCVGRYLPRYLCPLKYSFGILRYRSGCCAASLKRQVYAELQIKYIFIPCNCRGIIWIFW